VIEEGVERVDRDVSMSIDSVLAGIVAGSSSQCLKDLGVKVVIGENVNAQAIKHSERPNDIFFKIERLVLVPIIHCRQLFHERGL
jgi:hypothetical protein